MQLENWQLSIIAAIVCFICIMPIAKMTDKNRRK